MAKVGFFGGSFDPIHIGHLYLAITLKELHGLDEVLFCPAALSPHKVEKAPMVSGKARVDMIQLAIEGASFFTLLDEEIASGGISYTVDTMRKLVRLRPEDQFYLLLGEDAFDKLDTWKEKEVLVSLAPPLVVSRSDFLVSSTDVRLRLYQKKYCGHLVPQKVLDYIKEHRLYCPV